MLVLVDDTVKGHVAFACLGGVHAVVLEDFFQTGDPGFVKGTIAVDQFDPLPENEYLFLGLAVAL